MENYYVDKAKELAKRENDFPGYLIPCSHGYRHPSCYWCVEEPLPQLPLVPFPFCGKRKRDLLEEIEPLAEETSPPENDFVILEAETAADLEYEFVEFI